MQQSHEGGKPELLRPFDSKDLTKIAILQDLKALSDALHKYLCGLVKLVTVFIFESSFFWMKGLQKVSLLTLMTLKFNVRKECTAMNAFLLMFNE